MNRTTVAARGPAACLAIVLSLLAAVASGASIADGPYLFWQPDGAALARSIVIDDASRVVERRLTIGEAFEVAGVGALPSFGVQLRAPAPLAQDEVRVSAQTPIFVVADTHGEYEILGTLLQRQRIVDGSLRWSFGKGHVVFLGDVFDRGPNQIEILWLIYELQVQAAKAGGGVHLLIGNHESMVMRGDVRYLNPKYQRTARTLDAKSYADLIAADSVLGQWLRTRSAVLKIRDLLCLHGGIAPQIVDRRLSVPQINSILRDVLNGAEPPLGEFVMGREGPLWYRGYFAEVTDTPTASMDSVDRMLEHFDVARIVIGHTRVPTVTPLYEGKVIAVQVYPHRDESSGEPVMEALRVKGRRVERATIGGALEPL